MAQPGTDQHEGGVSVRETAHHTGAAADFPVKPFNDIIGADARPVFAGKIAVGKRLFDAIFYLLGGFFQFHGTKFLYNCFRLLPGGFFALLSMDRQSLRSKSFEHLLATSFTLERGVTENTLR